MHGQRATGKIHRNNYHHGNCGPSLMGKTLSVSLIFMLGTHRNVRNHQVRSGLKIWECGEDSTIRQARPAGERQSKRAVAEGGGMGRFVNLSPP